MISTTFITAANDSMMGEQCGKMTKKFPNPQIFPQAASERLDLFSCLGYGLQKDGQNSQYCGQNSSQDDQYSQDIQEDKHFYFDPKRLTEAQCCKRQL